VEDLCSAHLLSLQYLLDGGASASYNLGNGDGFSVHKVIDAARRVTGRTIKVVDAARRAGDPARLVADSSRAKNDLKWNPRYSDIDTIIGHAWKWELRMAGES
jgi:UDP-glucose 4-epimerase